MDHKTRAAQLEALREEFRKHEIRKVKLGGFDVDGVLRGKYVSLDKFWGVAESGLGFFDVIFGWDSGDALYDDGSVTGWHTGYPDAHATVDLSTYRRIPWEEATAAFLLDFEMPVSPRGVLQKVEQKARAMGFTIKCASEYEFFLFKETPESLRSKGFQNLTPLSPGMFGYSWLRASENAPLVHDLQDKLAAFDVELEAFHTETGPGVYEAAIRYDGLMRAADKAALFKTAVKEICARHGVMPCFMAKWNKELPGCSGHLHESLWTASGESAFLDPRGPRGMSKTLQHFVAGQVALMPAFTALIAPTINSYKRMVRGAWSPTTATRGAEDRTTGRGRPGRDRARVAAPGGDRGERIRRESRAASRHPPGGDRPTFRIEGSARFAGLDVRRPLRQDARVGMQAVRRRGDAVGAGAVL